MLQPPTTTLDRPQASCETGRRCVALRGPPLQTPAAQSIEKDAFASTTTSQREVGARYARKAGVASVTIV